MTSVAADITRLNELIQKYYLQPNLFQMELDYMYLDATESHEKFLSSIQKLFGGALPKYHDQKWEMWAKDAKFPWRADIAKVVLVALWEEFKLDCEIDLEIDRATALYESDIRNLSEGELMDRGFKKCRDCGHILSWNGGDWFVCDDEHCDCGRCAVRVSVES